MAEATIYTGFRVNWSKGPILGATLTLTSQNGFLLVSFLTLFVRMVAGHFWSVLCFILHQVKADVGPQDGLHHQHQLLLRNSQSHTSTLWDFIKVASYWRSNARKSIWRTLPLILISVVQVSVFTAAGLFSSRIASSSDEVLVRSPNCGYMQFPSNLNSAAGFQQMVDAFVYTRTTALWSNNYALNCYATNATGPGCNTFATSTLDFSWENTSCPFAGEMCMDLNVVALQISTRVINSDLDLGVNSRRKHSIDYRKVLTCAPLRKEGFMEYFGGNDRTAPGDLFLDLFYGPTSSGSDEYNWTFTFESDSDNYTREAYYLDSRYSLLNDTGSSNWTPIPQLNRTDADVTLMFLTTFADYPAAVADPFFNATMPVDLASFDNATSYVAEIQVGVLGCTEQHQSFLEFDGWWTTLQQSIKSF